MNINDYQKGTAFLKLCKNDFRTKSSFTKILKFCSSGKTNLLLYIPVENEGVVDTSHFVIRRTDFYYGEQFEEYLKFLCLPETCNEIYLDTTGTYSAT